MTLDFQALGFIKSPSPVAKSRSCVALTTEVLASLRFQECESSHTLPSVLQQGRTPLHYAAVLEDGADVYNALLDNGADENATDVVSVWILVGPHS